MSSKHFVVIVNYNSAAHIIPGIRNILSQRDVDPQIVVVDNASTDDSLAKCQRRFPTLTYITNHENIGFGAGANCGIRHACKNGAETITFMNLDASLEPDCLHRMIHAVESGAGDLVSPMIYRDQTKKELWFSGGHIDFWHMRAVHASPDDLSRPLPRNSFLSGCVLTISRRVFDTIGLFDERFFLYYEDADLSRRAQTHGFRLALVPKAHAYHEELSENNKDHKIYYLVLSGLLFFDKHTTPLTQHYFRLHYHLRRLKNYFDRKRNAPFAHAVHEALTAYKNYL
jgi:GT2 family glycosyltransferase